MTAPLSASSSLGNGSTTEVFELYTSLPIDYVDAFHAALMENRQRPEVYSYDGDFDRVVGLLRVEP
jgi:predicted nucleic acid-binding protein